MKTRIENFTLDLSNGHVQLSYTRSFKDLITTLFYVITSLVCFAVSTTITMWEIEKDGFDLISVFIIILFFYVGIIQFLKAYSLIKTPSGKILVRKKHQDFLSLRNHEKKCKIPVSELKAIEFQMSKDILTLDGQPTERYRIDAKLVLKGGIKEHLFLMNTRKIFTFEDQKHKKELKKSGKMLVRLLSKNLGIESRWQGHVRVDKS